MKGTSLHNAYTQKGK